MTFSECAEKWYKRSICGTTYDYQIEIFNTIKNLNKYIGNIEMKDLTWLDVEDVILSYARYNPRTKQPSSQRLLVDLRNVSYNVCEYAIDANEIVNNPVRRKKLPKSKPAKTRRPLTEEERGYVFNTYHRLRLPALIMLFCGLRPNEVIPLEFTDFVVPYPDKKTMILKITKSVSKVSTNEYIIKPGTKNGKSRTVTVPSALAEIIIEEEKKTDNNLITTQKNGNLHTPSSWKSAWKSYQNALNYTAYCLKGGTEGYYSPKKIPRNTNHITAYMFRHTYATMLYSSGVDILTASKLMGHSEIKTTLKVYTHLEEAMSIKNINKFENYINDNYSIILENL